MYFIHPSVNISGLALEHYQKVLRIFSQNCLHISKAIFYSNMAQNFYKKKNQLNETLNKYHQAATIFRHSRSSLSSKSHLY